MAPRQGQAHARPCQKRDYERRVIVTFATGLTQPC
jgi:hypothetical protein